MSRSVNRRLQSSPVQSTPVEKAQNLCLPASCKAVTRNPVSAVFSGPRTKKVNPTQNENLYSHE